MKQCCEYIRGLRYKLRMLGIPCDGPAYISGNNQSVLANTTIPESTLKKKSQSIAYHFVREGVARDEWRTAYVNTHENESDLLTKILPAGKKRRGFVRRLLHHIYGTLASRKRARIWGLVEYNMNHLFVTYVRCYYPKWISQNKLYVYMSLTTWEECLDRMSHPVNRVTRVLVTWCAHVCLGSCHPFLYRCHA